MSDLIDRQAAINAVNTALFPMINTAKDAEKALRDLPSAQPRPRGRWIDHTDDGYVECPFCGSATNCDDNISELHYCFSCGADMREEEQNE